MLKNRCSRGVALMCVVALMTLCGPVRADARVYDPDILAYVNSTATYVMQMGTVRREPHGTAQMSLDDANRDDLELANLVKLDYSTRTPVGYFFIKSVASGECLASSGTAGTSTYWEPCSVYSHPFYLAPSLRPGSFFIKPSGSDDTCLKFPQGTSVLGTGTSWRPALVSCNDGQDSHDALTTAADDGDVVNLMSWNFFPTDGEVLGDATETVTESFGLHEMAARRNVVKMCNWGAMVVYFQFDYDTTDADGVKTSGSYQSGTVTVGQCVEAPNIPNGFLAGSVVPVVQMQGAGPWAASGATSLVGWGADVTVHISGDSCNNWAWTTARSRNSATAIDEHPGTDCWSNKTKGAPFTFTYEDLMSFLFSMIPMTGGGTSLGASPTGLFSGLGQQFGAAKVPSMATGGGSRFLDLAKLAYKWAG